MTQNLTDHKKKSASLRMSLNRFSQNIKEVSEHTAHAVKPWHLIAIIIIFVFLLLSMIYLVGVESHKCIIDDEELDKCAQKLVFFETENGHFPSNNQELDMYCKQKRHSLQCLKQYVHSCLESDKIQNRFVRKYAFNYKKQLDNMCLHHAEREKFLTYSRCIDQNTIRNSTKCVEMHQRQLQYTAQYVPNNLHIGAGCCALHFKHKCIASLFENCDHAAQKYLLDQIEGPFRSIYSDLCSPYYLSLTSCQNRLDQSVWRSLLDKSDTSPSSNYSETAMPIEGGDTLKAELANLKFQETILALTFIIRQQKN